MGRKCSGALNKRARGGGTTDGDTLLQLQCDLQLSETVLPPRIDHIDGGGRTCSNESHVHSDWPRIPWRASANSGTQQAKAPESF